MQLPPKVITCRAAVAWEPDTPLKIEKVDVYPPKQGEVRVRMLASSICCTDVITLSGQVKGTFPCILGHEGAGQVDCVGPGVKSFKQGDLVILLYVPQCKECKYCLSKKANLCNKNKETQAQGLMPDGTTRFVCNRKPVFHYMGCSTFSEYTVVSMHSLCQIDKYAPLDKVCLFGCGVSTGYGAAINTAEVEEGSSCAIFGLGAVGLAVVIGCRERKAAKIVGIDINEDKFEIGRKLGCTDFINPKKLDRPIQEVLIDISDGGYDYTFECVGETSIMTAAFESCHEGFGQSIIIGNTVRGDTISTKPIQLIAGRTWKACVFGGWKSKDSIPYLVEQHKEKKINLDPFITHQLLLEEVNRGFSLQREGKSIRTVLYYGLQPNLSYYPTYESKQYSCMAE